MHTAPFLVASALALFPFSSCAPDSDRISGQSSELTQVNDSGTLARDEWRHYGPFDVHALSRIHAELDVKPGGDADLYVRQGAAPSASDWDCRPWASGSTPEDCEIRGPGVFYVGVAGYALSSEFRLRMFYVDADTQLDCGNGQIDPGEVCEIGSSSCADLDPALWSAGEASCDLNCGGYDTSACVPLAIDRSEFDDSASILRDQLRHYGPFSAADDSFVASLGGAGASGDADLYVKRGSDAAPDSFDCRSNGSESIEHCQLTGAGLYYVAVLGYAGSSDYTVTVSYLEDSANTPQVSDAANSVESGQWIEYGPFGAGASGLRAILSGLDDADLYIRKDAPASLDSYDCRPYKNGSDETCVMDGQGLYWIGVSGYAAATDFELKVVY